MNKKCLFVALALLAAVATSVLTAFGAGNSEPSIEGSGSERPFAIPNSILSSSRRPVGLTSSDLSLIPNVPDSEEHYRGASSGSAFTALEPYEINVMGVRTTVNLYKASRTSDYGGTVPFVNPKTRKADPAQLQGWDPMLGASRNVNGNDINNDGLPGRVDKRLSFTMVRYNRGDGITEGKCRTQLNSYAIPPRTRARWELTVAFGSNDGENNWILTPPKMSPVLFWQVKSSSGINPSMSAIVDTDPDDPTNSLMIAFTQRGGKASIVKSIAEVHGLRRNTLTSIIIEAFLDEREISEGGRGRELIWVNGKLLIDAEGPTLTWGPGIHNWSLSMYLFNESVPYTYTRASFWKEARLIVFP